MRDRGLWLYLGPSWLRQSLVADFEALGYQRNAYDKCLMTLPPSDPTAVVNSGMSLIEVDDILEGGDAYHQQQTELVLLQEV